MERFCIDITHFKIQRFMPQTFTPYLLNRENFLEHIFSLSIEFLYHSVSESSKAIIIHIYPWSCAVFIYSGPSPFSGVISVALSVNQADPSETAQGLKLYKAHSRCHFFTYFTHCTNVLSPWTTTKRRWEIYILGFFAMF